MAEVQKLFAQIIGVVLTLVGLAGFLAGDSLLGFGLNTWHNVVHLATGLIGIGVGFFAGMNACKFYNIVFGLTYVFVFILGIAIPDFMETLLNVNMADNILHLILGGAQAGVGFTAKT